MPNAEYEKNIPVEKNAFFEALTTYEDYPDFVDGVTSVEVKKLGKGKVRVTYHLSLIKEFVYTLEHEEDRSAGAIRWKLIGSDLFEKNEGSWELEEINDSETHAKYNLDVEFKVPVPGFIIKRLVKGNLPNMFKNFENKAVQIAKNSR